MKIVVTSDRSTTFNNNTAPTAPDISCSDNILDVVTCDFEGPIRETLHCDPGFPYWVIGVVGVVIILLAGVIGLVIHKIRQRRKQQESLPLLGAAGHS